MNFSFLSVYTNEANFLWEAIGLQNVAQYVSIQVQLNTALRLLVRYGNSGKVTVGLMRDAMRVRLHAFILFSHRFFQRPP